jgi:CRISPR/Cas system-associated exonuclease Cas4 (RecB family)
MVGENILVRATDIVRCVECPQRSYFAWFEGLPFEHYEHGTLWGSLEHNARAILMHRLREAYTNNKDSKQIRLESIIEKVIQEVYDKNPELEPYPVDIVKTQISDLRTRLKIEETARMARFEYLSAHMDIEDALNSSGLPIFIESSFHSSKLGLVGKIDSILFIDGKRIPLDYKCPDQMPEDRRYDVQLGVYSMLLEEKYGEPVPYGIIYDSKHFQNINVPITDELKNEIIQTREIHISIIQGNRPQANPSAKRCPKCAYKRSCPDAWNEKETKSESTVSTPDIFDRIMSTNGSLKIYDKVEVV